LFSFLLLFLVSGYIKLTILSFPVHVELFYRIVWLEYAG